MTLIVQSYTLINPWSNLHEELQLVKRLMTYTKMVSGDIRFEHKKIEDILYSRDSDDRTWAHIYCKSDNGESSWIYC